MIAATLRIEVDSTGRKYLSGRVTFDLPRGALVIMRKVDEATYSLVAVANDGRRGETSPETARSFQLIPADEVTLAARIGEKAEAVA